MAVRNKSRQDAARRNEFDSLVHLARLFRSSGVPWQVGNAGFEARMPIRIDGWSCTAVYKVHLVGYGEPRILFKGSVTLWPRRSSKVDKRTRERCGRALRRHGYRGEWLSSPWGRFGNYWKSLKDLKALRAELKLFERWVKEPPWEVAP